MRPCGGTDKAHAQPCLTGLGKEATVVATVVGWGTDAGAVRQLNEDAVSVGTKIFAVADGMGGHAAGDVASQMTVQALNELDTRELLRPADVVGALIGVSDTIARRAQAEPERWGMGTTVTGVALVTVGEVTIGASST